MVGQIDGRYIEEFCAPMFDDGTDNPAMPVIEGHVWTEYGDRPILYGDGVYCDPEWFWFVQEGTGNAPYELGYFWYGNCHEVDDNYDYVEDPDCQIQRYECYSLDEVADMVHRLDCGDWF